MHENDQRRIEHMKLHVGRLACAAAFLMLFVPLAPAQPYPTRQITLVVPFAPGGPADFLGRLVGQKMSEDLGQQIVVDNRPGANTIIAAQAVAKAAPGGFQIGISTPTSQVNVGLLNMMAGTNFTMVPYRGGTTQITGILAGDIALGMESINVALPLWRDKKVKILGLVSAQRLSLAPDIPTIAETYPGYDLGIWQSIVAPAGTPRDVVTKLHGSIKKVLALPDVREKLLNASIEPAGSNTAEEFAAFIRSQADTRAKVIQAVGMKLD